MVLGSAPNVIRMTKRWELNARMSGMRNAHAIQFSSVNKKETYLARPWVDGRMILKHSLEKLGVKELIIFS
jgi:hypothetical protein